MSKLTKSALLAGIALAAASVLATAAAAQDAAPMETTVVTAPHYAYERTPLNGVPGKMSISERVAYDDLDLRSRDGARGLRLRIRETARDICERLDADGPIAAYDSPPCYKATVEPAMLRAASAIRAARDVAYND